MPLTFDIHKVSFREISAEGYVPQNIFTKPPKVVVPKPEKPAKVVVEKAKKTASVSAKKTASVTQPEVKLNLKASPQNNYLVEKPAQKKKPAITIKNDFQMPQKPKVAVQQPVVQHVDIEPMHVQTVVQQESTVSSSDIPMIELPPIRVRQPPQPVQVPVAQPAVSRPPIAAVKQKRDDKLDLGKIYEQDLRLLSAQFKF